ncbi:MAG: CpsD/CapB family tyrosine-protein kinase [Oscillospiraceae bacterium]|nr:CpsD/CapB family tyrosine-protein kinase [Oscillospiraceae bacterium]
MGNYSSNQKKKTGGRPIAPHLSAKSPFAIKEAYNSIRTKLIFTGKGEKCPIFAVTSSLASDGKTTNAVNLAISFAIADQRVLLIDADMRKPSIHRHFECDCKNGLSEVLAGLTTEINLRETDVEHLTILTAGQIPPNPAELLSTEKMDTLLEYVRGYFDYVIIDTPPVNIVTDATVLAEKVTGFVFVTQSGKNHIRDISDALHQLEDMNANIVGMVLNDPTNEAENHYGYRYKRYYRSNGYRYGPDVSARSEKKEG